jgi:hypothetical protein
VLFKQRFWPGIRDGSITRTIRRWKSARVVAGRRYRTAAGMLEVIAVFPVSPDDITPGDARTSGYQTREELLADFSPKPGASLYRVDFRVVDESDPRATLASASALDQPAADEISRRLQRLDSASKHGPWTHATLRAIAAHPGQRAAALAETLGRDRDPLKVDIRKLKNLGLTLSLDVGYTISPRGAAYLHLFDDRHHRPASVPT